ncbi:hypothetical protein CVU83_01515 [Candidatus Falkowbacteria bacterium HGW-Falkowbacteria-2]|uniref:HD domain-containing protein n=1 Tax=Candidatus Falkowbacteria bacterium HGW-Falkowbacteria-2 TaxID=2013769 RepID=A0A2N2E1D9_9BACT|nr:MAG: hypothetical protein CVU83_01515 [Candidatus Falkowbacteria bacterium HGW-Falkowbacteria-2]
METIDKVNNGIDRSWKGVSDVWLAAQTILCGVVRWSKYENTFIRRQDDLQHSYSASILAKIFVEKLNPYFFPALDKELIISAFLVHDHGEGELKRDICYGSKPANCDLEEYQAFVKRYSQLGPAVFPSFERAYLLQYALEYKPDFPESAKAIMRDLAVDNGYEALCFTAIEIWDYLLYALEQDAAKTHNVILEEVLRNQVPRLDELAAKLPGFAKEIWTKEISSSLKSLIKW